MDDARSTMQVDDAVHRAGVALCITSKNPQSTMDASPVNHGLKGVGPIDFHLGTQFERDREAGLCFKQEY